MKNKVTREELAEVSGNPDMLFCDGFDSALMGFVHRSGMTPVACYSVAKMVETLKKDMTEEEAFEYLEFNVFGAYVGEFTPVFFEGPYGEWSGFKIRAHVWNLIRTLFRFYWNYGRSSFYQLFEMVYTRMVIPEKYLNPEYVSFMLMDETFLLSFLGLVIAALVVATVTFKLVLKTIKQF